jgi:hypothetical protein
LLFGGELAAIASKEAGGGMQRFVSASDADAAWRRGVAAHAGRFTVEYRAEPERLRTEAVARLERLGLLAAHANGDVAVFAALARYRAAVRLPEALDA